jgi:hypothetical protein
VGNYATLNPLAVNFGQRPFAYTAPSGFKALCTTNLPEPTIADGSSNGYSLGAFNGLNENTTTYVAWTWDAGSSTVTNTEGSITSQVRANASAGFSRLLLIRGMAR